MSSSGLAIRAPSAGARADRRSHTKVFTPYPYTHSCTTAGVDGEILPYMAQVQSPVRVTFNPGPSPKRKSRVSDQAKRSTFNFRPIRQGDRPELLRFKPPDATLPTVDYLSPWMSVTKLDFKDPLSVDGGLSDARGSLSSGLFRRSQTEYQLQSRTSTALSRSRMDTSSPSKCSTLQPASRLTSRQESWEAREVSVKSGSTEKRVTIVDPPPATLPAMDPADVPPKPHTSSPAASPKTRTRNLKLPDCEVNYYSGYLPPELSEKIASQLDISVNDNIDSVSETKDSCFSLMKSGPYYKPLVGDRSLFLRESYPVQPRTHQSDIEKLRFEGRERLLQSNGQTSAHFSALKDRGTQIRPKTRGVRLDEAVRKQQRLAKSAVVSRIPKHQTSLDLFERQRERTYNLQNLAREMIKK